MKVICIDANYHGNNGLKKPPFPLVEGNIYHVSYECLSRNKLGELIEAYVLHEMPQGGWERWRFIPLSDISETEMKRDYNVQPA